MARITGIIYYVASVFGLMYFQQTNAQNASDLKITYYYPKDSLRYQSDFPDQLYHMDKSAYGKTTMLIHVRSAVGTFDYVFKKKIINFQRHEGQYVDVYGWKPDGTNCVVRKDYIEPYTESEHNLYAFVYLYDHGGFLEKVKFQDFGNVVYWPEFDYPNCFAADEDKDGKPEFYLTYIGFADGLDPTAIKQIIYIIPENSKGKSFFKARAVHYQIKDPESDPEDYKDEFDTQWKKLPKVIRQKSLGILNTARTFIN